ncbi:MAG: type IX secretion system protein PorQ [Muribaculaceae bacterium]|nr:type IX secretion system protein PorQ [Muribaculaceae bacterium]
MLLIEVGKGKNKKFRPLKSVCSAIMNRGAVRMCASFKNRSVGRVAAIFASLALLPALVRAQSGETSYDFLNIPTSAHTYALGGAAPALIVDDVALADQNPALLGPEIERQISFGYMHYMGSGNFGAVRFGQGIGENSAWAAGVRYLNYGSMTQYDESGVSGGQFTPSDIVFEGSYSRDITDRWRGGVNLNMIYSHYDVYSAFAIAVDLGVNYYDDEHDLSFSFVLKNMGGQVKRFHEAYNRVPFDIQIGYMQGLGQSPFSLAITARNLTHWRLPYYSHPKDEAGSVGEEKSGFFSNFFRHLTFGLQYSPSEKFYIALGYDYKTRTDMSNYSRNFLSGFSVGAGIKVKSFGFDVAYAMPHKSASTLMLNLNCNFAELLH